MTQEEKQLLIKVLCEMLPYETRVRYIYAFAGAVGISGYSDEGILSYDKLQNFSLPNIGYEKRRVDNILPYLRPMSSMTNEEAKEIAILYGLKDILSIKITDEYIDVAVDDGVCSTERWTIWYDEIISSIEIFDLLNRKHFDYRGLIPMGLALEAPEGMYND